MKTYRTNGAIGALMDEYEKAILELKTVIEAISSADLIKVVDQETKDEDCRSIQTILTHVIGAGYAYLIEIRKWLGEDMDRPKKHLLHSTEEYKMALDKMFASNLQLFQDYPNIQLEENNIDLKMTVRWGQSYDVEQLMEHAIVHILRHRRQIERFIIKMKNTH